MRVKKSPPEGTIALGNAYYPSPQIIFFVTLISKSNFLVKKLVFKTDQSGSNPQINSGHLIKLYMTLTAKQNNSKFDSYITAIFCNRLWEALKRHLYARIAQLVESISLTNWGPKVRILVRAPIKNKCRISVSA